MTGAFRRLGEHELYRGPLITVARGTFEAPDGSTFQRDVVHHPGAVSVVPVLGAESGEVLLVRQYRAPVDRVVLEIPAGKRDVAAERPTDTARRELIEEVGQRAGRLELLAEFYNSPGFCDEATWIYLATGLHAVPPARDGFEERYLTVREVPLDDFDAMVDDGSIVDAQTILGVGLARRRLLASGGTPS